MGLLRRGRQQDASFHEEDAYARLHGERSGEIVRVSTVEKPQPAAPRNGEPNGDLTGERLRRAFETKLEARD